jgi:hypothetical protein
LRWAIADQKARAFRCTEHDVDIDDAGLRAHVQLLVADIDDFDGLPDGNLFRCGGEYHGGQGRAAHDELDITANGHAQGRHARRKRIGLRSLNQIRRRSQDC